MSDRSAPHRQIRQPGKRSPIGWSISDEELLAVATAMHVVRHPAGTVLVPARHNRRPGRRVPGYLLPRPGQVRGASRQRRDGRGHRATTVPSRAPSSPAAVASTGGVPRITAHPTRPPIRPR